MADVFVSYASSDRERVASLVAAFEGAGLSVWWDTRIEAGRSFDREIERELDAARCVVVVWSAAAVESDWVRTEAEEGVRRNALVPVRIDAVEPPLAFRRLQTIDASDGVDEPALRAVLARLGDGAVLEVPGVRQSASGRRLLYIGVTVAAALMAGVAIAWFGLSPEPGEDPPDFEVVAIMPFVDATASGEFEYLAMGLADELIGRFSELPDIRVPSLTRVAALGRRGSSLDEIAEATGADVVLEGVIRDAEGGLVVSASMTEVASGFQLWREEFPVGDGQSVQAQRMIAGRLALTVRPDLDSASREDVTNVGTTNPNAHAEYLLGRHVMRAVNLDQYLAAVERFEAAIVLDPDYQAARVMQAFALTLLVQVFGESEFEEQARAALATVDVSSLNRDLNRYYNDAIARLDADNFLHSEERRLREALLAAGEEATALEVASYGWMVGRSGLYELAVEYLELARRLDPMEVHAVRTLGQVHAAMGRRDLAKGLFQRCLDIQPEDNVCYYSMKHLELQKLGPAAFLEQSESNDDWPYFELMALTALGRHEEAAELHSQVFSHYLGYAVYHLWREDLDAAFEHWGRLDSLPDFFLVRQYTWPRHMVDRVRADPRYLPHLARAGLDDAWRAEVCRGSAELTPLTGIEPAC